jgi:lysophospholipase L1-like esterase
MRHSFDRRRDRTQRISARERRLLGCTVLLSLLIVFALAEAGLRVYAKFSAYIPKVNGYCALHALLVCMLVPNTTYESRAGSIHVNSRGFRGQEFQIPKPPGTFRILALGGSSTFGYYPGITSDEAAYPARLERLLNAQKPDASVSRYEVINAGAPGYKLRTSLQNFASRGLFFEPDMIIVSHVVNDIAMYGNEQGLTHPLEDQFVATGLGAGLLDHILGWSFAVQELRYALGERLPAWLLARNSGDNADSRAPSEPWKVDGRYIEVFRRDLRNIIAVAKANGVVPVLITEPISLTAQTDFARLTDDEIKMKLHKPVIFYARVPGKERYGLFKRYHDAIRQVAVQEGAWFIDVDGAIPKTSEYFWDYVHLTEKGAALQAAVIRKAILAAWAGSGSAGP